MSVKYDHITGAYAKLKYECDELESFGKNIGNSLANLLEKWKYDDDGNRKKSILRRISTKSKSLLLPKKKKQKDEKETDEIDDAENRITLPHLGGARRTELSISG